MFFYLCVCWYDYCHYSYSIFLWLLLYSYIHIYISYSCGPAVRVAENGRRLMKSWAAVPQSEEPDGTSARGSWSWCCTRPGKHRKIDGKIQHFFYGTCHYFDWPMASIAILTQPGWVRIFIGGWFNGEFQDPIHGGTVPGTILLAIFGGYIPWN